MRFLPKLTIVFLIASPGFPALQIERSTFRHPTCFMHEQLNARDMQCICGQSDLGFMGDLFFSLGKNATHRMNNFIKKRMLIREEQELLKIKNKLLLDIRMLKAQIQKCTAIKENKN